MRVIIAGSRGITDRSILDKAIADVTNRYGLVITEVVSGCASGVDMLGAKWAIDNMVSLTAFPADWSTGRSAGYRRNVQMAEYADALLCIWDGQSKGAAHMMNIARSKGLQVYAYYCGDNGSSPVFMRPGGLVHGS